jgi:hypothetical protein
VAEVVDESGARRAGDHGFSQPLHVCWADDACWEAIAGAASHSVGGEPYLREPFTAGGGPPR